MTTKQSEAVLLSLLGPRPVFWHDDRFNQVFCAWNGIVMTRSHALMLVSELFWHQAPTPEMKAVACRDFVRLYSAGAFENSHNWHGIIQNNAAENYMHYWYKQRLSPIIHKEFKDIDPKTVYSWFNFEEFC